MASQTHQLHKWLDNKDIDKTLSNDFWNSPAITNKLKTCLVKFRTGQYMGHAKKQLLFGRTAYPSHTCPICNSLEAYTWLHVLLKCKQQHIHALITNRHNKAVWEIRKLLISNKITRHYTLMNACIYNDSPQENTVPHDPHMRHPKMSLQCSALSPTYYVLLVIHTIPRHQKHPHQTSPHNT